MSCHVTNSNTSLRTKWVSAVILRLTSLHQAKDVVYDKCTSLHLTSCHFTSLTPTLPWELNDTLQLFTSRLISESIQQNHGKHTSFHFNSCHFTSLLMLTLSENLLNMISFNYSFQDSFQRLQCNPWKTHFTSCQFTSLINHPLRQLFQGSLQRIKT